MALEILSSLPLYQRRPPQFPRSSPGQPQAGPQVLTALHPEDKGPTWLSRQPAVVGEAPAAGRDQVDFEKEETERIQGWLGYSL